MGRRRNNPLEPIREKPVFRHAIIQGVLALPIAFFFTSSHAWDLTARISSETLNLVGVETVYVPSLFSIYVRLMDGTLTGFQVLLECSGLYIVSIFSFISIFTIGLLKGSLLKKIVWFLLSIGVGLIWNINRLTSVIIIAYSFGLSTFFFTHYFLGPFIDFLWVVSTWSIGMSWIREGKSS